MVAGRGLEIENVDCTVMMETPKLSPHRPAIRQSAQRMDAEGVVPDAVIHVPPTWR